VSKQTLTELVETLPVKHGATAVKVYPVDEARRGLDSADCPARILLPSTEGDSHTGRPAGTNKTTRMEWTVKDLLLFRPAEEGFGWLDVGWALDAYVDSYVAQINTYNHSTATGGFCTVQAEILEYSFLVGVQTFAGRDYYGVLTTLRIMQFIS
jgi:hypothetical protein